MHTISATELKSKISEVLNAVYYNKHVTVIERHSKPIAKIIPIEETGKKHLDDAWDHYFGILPDFPNVTKFRRSRKGKWSF